MKQTNNAIKFLMAQYRAIFQNAYFKGLATAAVVTMGLAAGQAQAGALSDVSTATGDITITGTSNDSGTGNKWESITSAAQTVSTSHKITINGGAATANSIKSKGGAI